MNDPVKTSHALALDIRALILDMDGVLWRSETAIGDLRAIFDEFERRNWRVVLATNNATRSPRQYLDKLAKFGVDHLEGWQIVNSGMAAADYLKKQHPQGGKVYIVGQEGLYDALQEQGFLFSEDDDVLAVVAGMDRQVNYNKLTHATLLIRAGAPFIGTNPDRTFPIPEGLAPGAGSILAALEAATDTKPIIIGKPGPAMYSLAMERLQTQPHQTLAIGDRLETDIAGAQTLGCLSAVVLSGVATAEEVGHWQPAPDFVAEDLTSLLEMLPAGQPLRK